MKPVRCSRAAWLAFGGLLLVVVLIALVQLNPELQDYDEGVYLVAAKSLALGHGYLQESLPGAPPHAVYPPLTSSLLALVWKCCPVFPQNLLLMRLLILVCGLLFLTLSWIYLKTAHRCDDVSAIGIITLIGLSPLFLVQVNLLTSDIPFALFSMASVVWYARFLSSEKAQPLRMSIAWAVLALLTRTVGIALIAALVLHLLLRRRIRPAVLVLLCGEGVFFLWQWWVRASDAWYQHYPEPIALNYQSYAMHLRFSLAALKAMLPVNLTRLVKGLTGFVFPWDPNAAHRLLIWSLTAFGVARSLRRQVRVSDLYCVTMLAILPFWPWPANARFLLAISPFLLVYSVKGLQRILFKTFRSFRPPARAWHLSQLALAGVLLIVLSVRLVSFQTISIRRNHFTPLYVEFHRMMEWVTTHTSQHAILVGDFDPAYYLFTGRHAIRLAFPDPFILWYHGPTAPRAPNGQAFLSWFRTMHACYVVEDRLMGGKEKIYDHDLIQALKDVSQDALTPVYTGQDRAFAVYRIADCHD